MKRKTGIICTIGPASRKRETLIKMAEAGMSMVRLNFSHGTHEEHLKFINTIRDINQKCQYDIKILQDLEGYRIRIGYLSSLVDLKKKTVVWISNNSLPKKNAIPLEFDGDLSSIEKGMDVFIDDGNLHLKVLGSSEKNLKLEVLQGGVLKSRKGVNIPDLKLKANIVTEKDKRDMAFGILHKVDYIAQSFVRNKQDILRVSRRVKVHLPKCKIVAKIENHQGLNNIENIIDASDAILVARGDLGVSLPIYKIPIIQKDIICHCRKKKMPVFVATQMLESMTENPRPTRAEVSDVANAILDGANYVMLSGETAVGKFPVKSVEMMCQIIDYTEQTALHPKGKDFIHQA